MRQGRERILHQSNAEEKRNGRPYCTMVLSDHGAEVIKLEPPQGDETRESGPPFDDAGDASYFLGINRNKKASLSI